MTDTLVLYVNAPINAYYTTFSMVYIIIKQYVYLSVEPVATHESTGVTGVHVLIADHTRPLVRVL